MLGISMETAWHIAWLDMRSDACSGDYGRFVVFRFTCLHHDTENRAQFLNDVHVSLPRARLLTHTSAIYVSRALDCC